MSKSESDSRSTGIADRAIPAAQYLKEHPQPVILHFQPRAFVPMETPKQLQQWEKLVATQVGLEVPTTAGHSYTHTVCAPPPSDPDDCEQD
jgi:hypothetical protein